MPTNNAKDFDAQQLNKFLQEKDQFQLGGLTTEASHPLTHDLSNYANHDLNTGIRVLKEIDLAALAVVLKQMEKLEHLRQTICQTLNNGKKIFICGCGATGRLAIALEYLWRGMIERQVQFAHQVDSVIGFMAGGDTALIRSIENFEDHPEFGAQQLSELGFAADDLLIAVTEGGETPFVIGATQHALSISSQSPFFLYCNPDRDLEPIARSRAIIENPDIYKINLTVGPMALSGSTRMQSCTALMAAVGLALLNPLEKTSPAKQLVDFHRFLQKTSFQFLEPFIEEEARIYGNDQHVLYQTKDYGITVLTDTTERSPTFSLNAFENKIDIQHSSQPDAIPRSLCYLCLPDTRDSQDAWKTLLKRPPRTLNWQQFQPFTTSDYINGFDFSQQRLLSHRDTDHSFLIMPQKTHILFQFGPCQARIGCPNLSPLFKQLLVKMLLNIHSTLIMGHLHRYQGNLMTYVKPSNYKLIDRAIRYVDELLKREQIVIPYAQIAQQLFREIPNLRPNDAIVTKTFAALKRKESP